MKAALLALALAACATGIDPEWQLSHERIVAVRATPPRMPAGTTATLEVLIAHKDAPTAEQPPDLAQVVSPNALAGAVALDGTITAPADLSAARAELMLTASAPVPLVIGIVARGFAATKTVWLGDTGDNPTLADAMVDGVVASGDLVVGKDIDVPLSVTADASTDRIDWMTSCGTMHDFDLPRAYLHVLPTDPQEGELALVVRTPNGGVGWKTWKIRAE